MKAREFRGLLLFMGAVAEAAYYLEDWLNAAMQSNIKEMIYAAQTITYWKQEILNYFTFEPF